MNAVELLLTAEAAASGRARPRRALRHTHIEPAPLAIAVMQMAGEPHALWAALVGTHPDRPGLIVAPEPRNRDIAFAALADFAGEICDAVDRAAVAPRVEVTNRAGDTYARFSTAPQLLVANRAVVDLLDRLGRRMRPAGFGGHVSVPPSINLAGAHLGFFAEAARHPGSALVLVATEQLAHHRVTGQSALEDAHLGAQLAWWDPAFAERIVPGCLRGADPARLHGADAAALIEQVPMSVLTDPTADNTILLEAVIRFNRAWAGATDGSTVERLGAEIAELLLEALAPTWRGLWVAHEVLAALPAAPGAETRWTTDLARLTRHVAFLEQGGRPATVHSARRAAMLLADWERAQAAMERDEIFEDALALAAALAAGQALDGQVLEVDAAHREPGPSGTRLVNRPLITLACADECPFPVGTELWWTERPGSVKAEVARSEPVIGGGARVVLKIVEGMKGSLPSAGSHAIFSIYTTRSVPPAPLPSATPWTHIFDPSIDQDALDLDDGPPLDEVLMVEGVSEASRLADRAALPGAR